MHELKPVLRHSVNMNINVQPLNLLGQRLGLEFVRSWSMCDDPFGINVDIFGDGIKWAVYHDARFINAETAGGLLRDVRDVFALIVDADRQLELTVGDVLKGYQKSELRACSLEHATSSSCWMLSDGKLSS